MAAGTIAEALRLLDASEIVEADQFPNKALVNLHTGRAALGPASGLSERYTEVRQQLKQLKSSPGEWQQLHDLQVLLLRSRWLALGRFLGSTPKPPTSAGSPALHRQEYLRQLTGCAWVRMGRAIGSKSCRRLAALQAEAIIAAKADAEA